MDRRAASFTPTLLLVLSAASQAIWAQQYDPYASIPGISSYPGEDDKSQYPIQVPSTNTGGYIPTYGQGSQKPYLPTTGYRWPTANEYLVHRLSAALGLTGSSAGSNPRASYPQVYPSASSYQSGKASYQPDLYKQIDQIQREHYGTGYNGPSQSPGYGQGQKCSPGDRNQPCQGFLLACQCKECPAHGGCYHYCC